MLRGKRVRLRCPYHFHFPVKPFREERGAQIVIAHVRGKNDSTFAGGELLQKSRTLKLVTKPRVQDSICRGVS